LTCPYTLAEVLLSIPSASGSSPAVVRGKKELIDRPVVVLLELETLGK